MTNFVGSLLMLFASAQLAQSASPAPGSPYKLSYKGSSKVSKGTRHCWELQAFQQLGGQGCSNFDLRKIEFDLSLQCRGKATDLTFDGQPLAISFQSFPAPGLVLKVIRAGESNLLSTQASLIRKKVPVCFTLYNGPCSPLAKFCRNGDKCDTAFFGPGNKCYSV